MALKKNQGTTMWRLGDLIAFARENMVKPTHDSKYVPCRPLGWTSLKYRLRAAWMVFTGKADAVTWPRGQ